VGSAAVGRADLAWFDETAGGAGYGSFGALADAYGAFMPSDATTITFGGFAAGTHVLDQYADEYGVSFTNVGGGLYDALSGVQPEAGAYVENLTGYDGSYRANGDEVYLRFDNNDVAAPFTIWFDEPVSQVGAFLGMGKEGEVHSIRVSLFDQNDTLLGSRDVTSWLWDSTTTQQNYETFFGVTAAVPTISRVELLNLSQTDYSNALVIDDLAWSLSTGSRSVPEPGAMVLLAVGGLLVWRWMGSLRIR